MRKLMLFCAGLDAACFVYFTLTHDPGGQVITLTSAVICLGVASAEKLR